MTSQPGKQTTAILLNISSSKYNQALKFDQLIQYITSKTFFLKSPKQNMEKKLFADSFLKNPN